MANLSAENLREMLSIIREARNDLKKLHDTASMISSALSKPEELNLKKNAENPLSLEGDESVLLKLPNVCEVVDGRNHQMLARNASGGGEMSRNFENPLGNFVEHMVGQKQQKVSGIENPKMEWYNDRFGLQAPLSTSSVTSPLPKKTPDPPDMIHGKSRNKGNNHHVSESKLANWEQSACKAVPDVVKMTTLRLVDSVVMIVNAARGVKDDKLSFTDYKSSELIDTKFSRQRSGQVTEPLSMKNVVYEINVNNSGSRAWEPGGLSAETVQCYWPEKCKSLWISAATSDMRLMRQLHTQALEHSNRVWERGRLHVEKVYVDCLGKTNILKTTVRVAGRGLSHLVYWSDQNRSFETGSFKMLGRETGNNTHWLEDKREAQHKQNEVMKLTSS
ncbi:unnamed protein product, partial [Brassica rapa subsp. narinosa]